MNANLSEDPEKHLRGVGVGAGYFSQYQYDAWSRIPGVTITAVADPDEERARRAAGRFGIARTYRDAEEMFDREQPDFVDLITPPHTHEALCRLAAERGISIICQKPLAPSYKEAVRLVETIEAMGVRLAVHENWRWQPWYRKVKHLLEDGTLGEPFTLYFQMRTGDGWRDDAYLHRQPYFRDYPRLLLFETGVHFVDAFRFLFGEVEQVCTHLRRLNAHIKGEDSGQVFLAFENGVTALYDANRYNEADGAAPPRYTFGTMRLDASRGHLMLHGDGRLTFKPLGEAAYEVDYDRTERGFAGDSCYHLQAHIAQALRTGDPFDPAPRDYLRTLHVVEACYESARTNRIVPLGASFEDAIGSVA